MADQIYRFEQKHKWLEPVDIEMESLSGVGLVSK
jgi:hypothetical protein